MTAEEQFVSSAIKSWKLWIGRFDGIVEAADDAKLQQRIAPGRNRIAYLVGHLAAVHDRMLPLLGLGERLHPELDAAYLDNPDGTHPDPLSPSDLKNAWKEVNGKLTAGMDALGPKEWLDRHTSVSEEDFAKDPSRNRLSVLLSRTSHVAMHLGQAVLVK